MGKRKWKRHRYYNSYEESFYQNNKEIIIIFVIIAIIIGLMFLVVHDVGGIGTALKEKVSALGSFKFDKTAYLIVETDWYCSMMDGHQKESCQMECGSYDLEYSKYKCVADKLECYCPKK